MNRWVFVPTSDARLEHITLPLAQEPDWLVMAESELAAVAFSFPEGTEAAVVPLSTARHLLPSAPSDPPLLVYGSPEGIGRAFLIGAADYLCEPVSMEELLVRTYRCARPVGFGRVSYEGAVVTTALGHGVLSGREQELWDVFLRHPGRTIDRQELQRIWTGLGPPADPAAERSAGRPGNGGRDRALDMAVSRLRRSLRETGIRIVAVKGRGYRLELP